MRRHSNSMKKNYDYVEKVTKSSTKFITKATFDELESKYIVSTESDDKKLANYHYYQWPICGFNYCWCLCIVFSQKIFHPEY